MVSLVAKLESKWLWIYIYIYIQIYIYIEREREREIHTLVWTCAYPCTKLLVYVHSETSFGD